MSPFLPITQLWLRKNGYFYHIRSWRTFVCYVVRFPKPPFRILKAIWGIWPAANPTLQYTDTPSLSWQEKNGIYFLSRKNMTRFCMLRVQDFKSELGTLKPAAASPNLLVTPSLSFPSSFQICLLPAHLGQLGIVENCLRWPKRQIEVFPKSLRAIFPSGGAFLLT